MTGLAEQPLRERLQTYVNRAGAFGTRGMDGLDYRCGQLFKAAGPLAGRRFLEIGGGEGLFCAWALAQGAEIAVNLEPVAAGSTSTAIERFNIHRAALGLDASRLVLHPVPLQAYDGAEAPFDVVLSYSSINHLDEEACVALLDDRAAWDTYVGIFGEVARLMRPGGTLIVQDAARVNYWNAVGLKSPFCPMIEWHKHHEPETWARLLRESGFEPVHQEWLNYRKLDGVPALQQSSVVARATLSQFVLTLRRR